MEKDTCELLEELKNFSNFNDYIETNKESIVKIKLSEYLENLINKKDLDKAKIVKQSELNEIYAYQIISGVKSNPTRNKVLCLIFGMELTFDEAQELLKKTGFKPLYAKDPFDTVIVYSLLNKKNVIETNNLLYEYNQETLG